MPLDPQAVAVPVGRSAGGPVLEPRGEARSQPANPESLRLDELTPPIDIYEGADGLILEADLPGVGDDRLTIRLEANVLILHGDIEPTAAARARLIHEEYRPGNFRRSFILSDEVDRSRITATLRNGVLRVVLPRAERARTRRIEIKSS